MKQQGYKINMTAEEIDNTLEALQTDNNVEFYFDFKNGKYGFNTSPDREAATFTPFGNDIAAAMFKIGYENIIYMEKEHNILFKTIPDGYMMSRTNKMIYGEEIELEG